MPKGIGWYWLLDDAPGKVLAGARCEVVPADDADYKAFLAGGAKPYQAASAEAVYADWAAIGVGPARLVRKSVIVQRLHEAGKLQAAQSALNSDIYARERWYAPDQPAVRANNPEVLALLAAIGADADQILAE